MTMRDKIPTPRIPAPGEILNPIVGVEDSLIRAVQAPFISFGLPVPPRIQGPVALVNSVVSQVPAPPQLPRIPTPDMPRFK